jgi:16S rRNA (guanine966-N2)-methyltransferase
VEREATAARELKARLLEWGAPDARVEHTEALAFLGGAAARAFDLVFLDPPFDSDLVPRAAALLEQRGWLSPRALIYVEYAARSAAPALPPAWTLLKAKQAGEVGYHLYARAALNAPTPHET